MPAQLSPGADPEFGEDLAEVPLDGSRAEVQCSGDLGAGEPFRSEPGDVGFLGCQVSVCLYRTFAYRLPTCCEFVSRAISECLNSHRDQRLVGRSQLGPGIGPAAFPAQPFAVEELRAGELDPDLV